MTVLFKRLKSDVYEGNADKLRRVIETHRSIPASSVEREFDEHWAKQLMDRIAKGLSIMFFWAVADMPLDGKTVRMRMNGNHSSWALHEMLQAGTLPNGLAIHLDTYSVADQNGAVTLFRQFDSRESSRSKEDIAGAYQCFHEAIRNVRRSIAKVAVEGAAWYRRELQGIPVPSGDDLYELFNEERLHPFINMVGEIINTKSSELKRIPITAAMYGTTLADTRKAEEFWKLVALGSKRGQSDAASDLDDELVRLKENVDKEVVRAGDLYAKCAKAWAAYEDGGRITNFKVNTKAKGLPVIAA